MLFSQKLIKFLNNYITYLHSYKCNIVVKIKFIPYGKSK